MGQKKYLRKPDLNSHFKQRGNILYLDLAATRLPRDKGIFSGLGHYSISLLAKGIKL